MSNKHSDLQGMVRIDAIWKGDSMDTLFFDLITLNLVDSVLLNQAKKEHIHENDLLKIPFAFYLSFTT